MFKSSVLKAGDFCWAELYAYDIDKSLRFYTDLLRWEIQPLPIGQDISYKMIKINDNAIAGGIRINEAMKKGGVRPHWNAFVLVNDIQATIAMAIKSGGTIMRDIFNIPEKGSMAIIVDPAGASISLWQPLIAMSAPALSKCMPGNIGWSTLITNDVDRACKFYCDLFQWRIKRVDSSVVLLNKHNPIAGVFKANDERAYWNIHFTTNNLDDCVSHAVKLGGSLCDGSVSLADVGKFVMISAPDGVFFSVIQRIYKDKTDL